MDWVRLSRGEPRFFAWDEVRAAWEAMDPNLGDTPVRFAQQLLGDGTRGCCGRAVAERTWISIGTSDDAWAAGDQRCGWLTICESCGQQVDFVVDEEITQLRREGNW